MDFDKLLYYIGNYLALITSVIGMLENNKYCEEKYNDEAFFNIAEEFEALADSAYLDKLNPEELEHINEVDKEVINNLLNNLIKNNQNTDIQHKGKGIIFYPEEDESVLAALKVMFDVTKDLNIKNTIYKYLTENHSDYITCKNCAVNTDEALKPLCKTCFRGLTYTDNKIEV